MLDRASSLQDPEVIKLLTSRFVPVAVDQHIHRVLKDDEGALFARLLQQAGRGHICPLPCTPIGWPGAPCTHPTGRTSWYVLL